MVLQRASRAVFSVKAVSQACILIITSHIREGAPGGDKLGVGR